jgi:hypothetical protein
MLLYLVIPETQRSFRTEYGGGGYVDKKYIPKYFGCSVVHFETWLSKNSSYGEDFVLQIGTSILPAVHASRDPLLKKCVCSARL